MSSWRPSGTNNIPVSRNRRRSASPSNHGSSRNGDYARGHDSRHDRRKYRDRSPSPRHSHSYKEPREQIPSLEEQMRQFNAPRVEETKESTEVVVDTGTLPDGRRRRKANRWAPDQTKINIPGMPTAITSDMGKDKMELYTSVVYVRIEEINRKLRMNEVVPPDGQRSPSPEPTYGTDGKRANTREVRYRQRLESERHNLISQATKIDPTFKPPIDYKRPGKCSDKVYIPDREFPEINFIGLLIGPRGNTLKKMEHDSGAKLSIRGRGSVKEGKIPTSADGIDEDLHCLITADDPEKVRKAVSMIEKIVEAACSAPEQINDLKRMQLRELAALNGTLRDEDIACSNCGSLGHRRWECTEAENLTQAIVCRICGNAGHVASDCLKRNDPIALQEAIQRNMMMDSEYANLMRELGENVPAPTMVPGMNPYGMQMALPGQAMAGMLTWAPDGAASTGAPWAMQMGGVLPPGLDAPPGVAPGQVPWTAAAYAMPPPEFGAPSAEVAAAPWHMAAGGMDMYPAPPAQPPPPPPPPRE